MQGERMLTMVAYHNAVEQSGNATVQYSDVRGVQHLKNVNTATTTAAEE